MRVHIQNEGTGGPFNVTRAQWEDAVARARRTDAAVSCADTRAGFAAALADADLLVAAPGVLRKLLPLPPNRLHTIFTLAAGMDHLAPYDWLPAGVEIWNNRGTHGAKAGEYVLMAALMLAARIPAFVAAQRERRWAPVNTPVADGLHVTIVGTGDLGSGAARRLRLLGMDVTGVSRSGAPHADFGRVVAVAELDAVLAATEILVLACPLTRETHGLIDARRLARLPDGAGLINIGRGGLLDQAALCDRLDSGALSGAILDVTEPEPPPPDDRVWTTPRLLLTPHVSADDPAAYNRLSLDILFDNLARAASGETPPNRVDPARGY